jgi:hypothetical protein
MATKTWTDEKGMEIPYSRTTKYERKAQKQTKRLLNEALKINGKLHAFKEEVAKAAEDLWMEALKEAGSSAKESKGNITIYNFDRTIKMEVNVSERIEFDDALITAAKEKFDEFLDANTTGVDEMIRMLIHDAFETVRGKLDTKRVMSLVSYRQRINDKKYPNFHEAIDLIEKSIRRPSSKKYFRIWYRDEAGEYQNVDLNFSSI